MIRMLHRLVLLVLFSSGAAGLASPLHAQTPSASPIDLSEFMDSAHHWRDITDEDHVITALPHQAVYPATEVSRIADNIVLFQKHNGGWAKNYDMRAVLTDEQKAAVRQAAAATNTTFDNGTTHAQVAYLAQAYARTHNPRYKDACVRGIDFMLAAQYANGGWPQFFPKPEGYARCITFNDGAMIGVMKVLGAVVRNDSVYRFVDGARRERVRRAFDKGLECILRTQIQDNGMLTVWCQQYDEHTLAPAPARTFEPACITNLESTEIVEFLMDLDHPSEAVKRSICAALDWFDHAKLSATRVVVIPAPTVTYQYHTSSNDRVVVTDTSAPAIWTRFTELGTHKALFSNRNWKKVYTLAEVDRERRTGYSWYTYAPQRVLDRSAAWRQRWMPSIKK